MNSFAETQTPGATTLIAAGMTCTGRARTMERVPSRVSEVERTTVDFDLGVAIVFGSAAPAVEAASYGASPVGENNKRKEQ